MLRNDEGCDGPKGWGQEAVAKAHADNGDERVPIWEGQHHVAEECNDNGYDTVENVPTSFIQQKPQGGRGGSRQQVNQAWMKKNLIQSDR